MLKYVWIFLVAFTVPVSAMAQLPQCIGGEPYCQPIGVTPPTKQKDHQLEQRCRAKVGKEGVEGEGRDRAGLQVQRHSDCMMER